jgi:formyltetrahydrofolate hydrolase
MKKLVILFLIVLVTYSIYYDLSKGTLPVGNVSAAISSQEVAKESSIPTEKDYIIIKVKAGDTVLSLVEQQQSGSLPVEIGQVISDFKKLNEGLPPEKIQIGKEYKVPLYKK